MAMRRSRIAPSRAHWSWLPTALPFLLCAWPSARNLSFHSRSNISATRRLAGSTSMKRRCARSASICARSTARRRSWSASACRASISLLISSAISTAAGVIRSAINSADRFVDGRGRRSTGSSARQESRALDRRHTKLPADRVGRRNEHAGAGRNGRIQLALAARPSPPSGARFLWPHILDHWPQASRGFAGIAPR